MAGPIGLGRAQAGSNSSENQSEPEPGPEQSFATPARGPRVLVEKGKRHGGKGQAIGRQVADRRLETSDRRPQTQELNHQAAKINGWVGGGLAHGSLIDCEFAQLVPLLALQTQASASR